MVRAGEGGYLFSEFAKGFVAIGWNEFGDMSKVRDIEETRKQYIKAYPETKAGAVANQVSMFYKFLNVMKVNDNVITFDPNSREYLVGTIISDYYYKSGEVKDYPHVRKVKWSGRITRDSLSASSRNSLGSTLTLMSINDDVWAEIVNALKGQSKATSAEAVAEEKKDLQQIKEDTIERAHELIDGFRMAETQILGYNWPTLVKKDGDDLFDDGRPIPWTLRLSNTVIAKLLARYHTKF